MRIKTFAALRPAPQDAERVACLPYDVLSREEARTLAAQNPMSFLHVVRPDIDLPDEVTACSLALYQKAAQNLRRLIENGHMIREQQPHLYVYRITTNDHQQTGVVALSHTGDYEQGKIKKHEFTREAPEKDRTNHIKQLKAQTGPVFLAYKDKPEINDLLEDVTQNTPLYDIIDEIGDRHCIWIIADPAALTAEFAKIPETYIADGHHRSAAAARVARECRDANPNDPENAEYNWYLTALFPASELRIMAYNRCVKDLNNLTQAEFMSALRQNFNLTENSNATPTRPGNMKMYLAGVWHSLDIKKLPDKDDVVNAMDVTILQEQILSPILGLKDPRQNPRISFVGGNRGTVELEKRVDSGEAAVAFSLYPTSIEELMVVSDSGRVMPPKSTWFEPKLRSGLFIHLLDT